MFYQGTESHFFMAPSPNVLFLLFLIIVCEKEQIKIAIYLLYSDVPQ
jgi:hypothetical protein